VWAGLSDGDAAEKLNEFRRLLCLLPAINHATLHAIIDHLTQSVTAGRYWSVCVWVSGQNGD